LKFVVQNEGPLYRPDAAYPGVRLEKGKLHVQLSCIDLEVLIASSTVAFHVYNKASLEEKTEWSHCWDADFAFCPHEN
jgi:hypothetical protein